MPRNRIWTFFARGLRKRNESPDCSRPVNQSSDSNTSQKDAFRFAPELFEFRTQVVEQLSDAGFDWLSHYSAVDPLHDVYGIEVCGIHDRDDAIAIRNILMRMFPSWKPG